MIKPTIAPKEGWLAFLSGPQIPFYILPPLMLMLVAGTLAQHEIGLYRAQHIFFSGFILWLGPVPLPGAFLFMGILILSLGLKFFFRSHWNVSQAGIVLTHLGALVLLCGGMITSMVAREGFMAIAEGTQSPYVYDYHIRKLYVFKDDRLNAQVDFSDLNMSKDVHLPGELPFTLRIVETCKNCAIEERAKSAQVLPEGIRLRSMAQFMALKEQPPGREPEREIRGASLLLQGAGPAEDGLYVVFDGMPKPIGFQRSGHDYKIILGREQRPLPFAVFVRDFYRENHPGTQKAKVFSTDLEIVEGDFRWPARVEMNQPLHYKGYTFYQSSFEEDENGAVSVLSVVQNEGRIFPYIGTGIMAAGLIWHLLTARKKVRAP